MTLRYYLIFMLLIGFYSLEAQLADDFSSGSLDQWEGDVNDFIINNSGELQLNAPEAGTSSIWRSLDFPDSLRWSFKVNLRYSPSSNNNLQVVLATDNIDLTQANAYTLQLGESGSNDPVRFNQVINGAESNIISGVEGNVASSFEYLFTIEKNGEDQWNLSVSDFDTGSLIDELIFPLDDNFIESTMFFGFICNYTSSNADNFLFDNIFISEILPDNTGPVVRMTNVNDATTLEVNFNEPVDVDLASDPNNYIFSNGISVESAEVVSEVAVILSLEEALNSCQSYELIVENLTDLVGNIVQENSSIIRYAERPLPGDILINELLSNPIGSGSDFVEITNVTSKTLDLSGLIIRNVDRNDESILENNLILEPGEIVAITESATNLQLVYATPMNARLIENDLPGFNNTEGNVSLVLIINQEEVILDSYNYDDAQLSSSLSSTDGVSFERMALIVESDNFENWTSGDESSNFASPGYANINAVELEHFIVKVINEFEIEIRFLDQVDASSASNLDRYNLNDINISDVFFDDSDRKTVILFLADPLLSGRFYECYVLGVQNLCGEFLPGGEFIVNLIEEPELGDLFINEILFNPFKDQFDFVEIKNVSDKLINLKGLEISNSQNGQSETILFDFIIGQNEIVAFTEDVDIVSQQYEVPTNAVILQQELPAFNDDEGNVTIRYNSNNQSTVLDSFDYFEEYHYELLRDEEGVSLERLSISTDNTNVPENWFSSAEANNFATPGYENSAVLSPPEEGNEGEVVFLSYKTFSPNGDSDKDILIINYNFDKPGYVGNVAVHDDRGRFERQLASNELVANQGFIRWDGLNAEGNISPIGMYIITYEFFHPDGDVESGKKVCVLAQFLD